MFWFVRFAILLYSGENWIFFTTPLLCVLLQSFENIRCSHYFSVNFQGGACCMKSSRVSSFFCSYARSILYAKHLYPNPIPLLYNPFTIVLHKRRSAYLFGAAQTPCFAAIGSPPLVYRLRYPAPSIITLDVYRLHTLPGVSSSISTNLGCLCGVVLWWFLLEIQVKQRWAQLVLHGWVTMAEVRRTVGCINAAKKTLSNGTWC